MSLSVGSPAPDFELPSTNGKTFKLSRDAAQQPCILYFYPKDFTPVCTKEACSFRDTFDYFSNLNITVLGISRDDIATHLEFKKIYNLPFDLLSDVNVAVAQKYDAVMPFINMPKRVTYLLDANHQIAGSYDNIFASQKHIDEMIRRIEKQALTK